MPPRTAVNVPSLVELMDAAIDLSEVFRSAKVEAPLRPRVIGALTLAMYQGTIDSLEHRELESINSLLDQAIKESMDLDANKKKRLSESLRLFGADYDRLRPHIARIVHLLRGLNIPSVLQTDTDFFGLFYEAFLRYGYDNNALGIVFTPRHITHLCVDLIDVQPTDKVVDLACGTGGFLVAAFDRMMTGARDLKAVQKVKGALFGFETNPTIWALATLNMFFRGNGKSHLENVSCFDPAARAAVKGYCTKAFLNPPFSQAGEPERDFIDASMDALMPGGLLAVVVKAGMFADDDNSAWRREFTRNHTVLGMISLPDDLFYPTAAPSSILIAKAHVPQDVHGRVFMARIWNDGFEKRKGRRVPIEGSQLQETVEAFASFLMDEKVCGDHVSIVYSKSILDGNEWSPQQWLPQPILSEENLKKHEDDVRLAIYRAVAAMPELADIVLPNFLEDEKSLPDYHFCKTATVSHFFHVVNGRSKGERSYPEGGIPYISSGDKTNSIVRLVNGVDAELFDSGGITVTAFGQAHLQPWPFMARGNGGSAVRVLLPRFHMTFNEMVWFASQINAQRWRFFYARMSIKSRLEHLEITSPPHRLEDKGEMIHEKVKNFKNKLLELSGAD